MQLLTFTLSSGNLFFLSFPLFSAIEENIFIHTNKRQLRFDRHHQKRRTTTTLNPLSLLFTVSFSLLFMNGTLSSTFPSFVSTDTSSLLLPNYQRDDHSWLDWIELLSLSPPPSIFTRSLILSFSLTLPLSPHPFEWYIDNPVTLLKWAPWRSLTLPHHHHHHHGRLAFFLYKQKSPRANSSSWINPANPITVTIATNKQTNSTHHTKDPYLTIPLPSSLSSLPLTSSLYLLPTSFFPCCASPIWFFFLLALTPAQRHFCALALSFPYI